MHVKHNSPNGNIQMMTNRINIWLMLMSIQCDRYILTDHKFSYIFFILLKSRVEREKNSDIEHLTKKTSRQHFCETAFFMPNHCLALLISFRLFCVHGMHALHCSSTANWYCWKNYTKIIGVRFSQSHQGRQKKN